MDMKLQRYYEDRFDLFAHPGWKELMVDVQEMLNASNTLDGATPENVEFKKGEIAMMRWMLSIQKTTEDAYEELTNANNP